MAQLQDFARRTSYGIGQNTWPLLQVDRVDTRFHVKLVQSSPLFVPG